MRPSHPPVDISPEFSLLVEPVLSIAVKSGKVPGISLSGPFWTILKYACYVIYGGYGGYGAMILVIIRRIISSFPSSMVYYLEHILVLPKMLRNLSNSVTRKLV